MAVPTFFAISGYFLYDSDKIREKNNAKKFIINSFKYLCIGFLIYIIYDFFCVIKHNGDISDFFKGLYVNDFVKNIIFLNNPITSGYHLWFLIALVVVSLIHYLLCYFEKTKYYCVIIPICLCIGLFFGGYINLIQPNSVNLMYAPRNALFMGLPMVGIGYLLNKMTFLHKKSFYKWIYLFLGIVMFFLQMVEYKILPMEIYNSSIFSSIFLLLFFVQLKNCSNSKFSNFYYKYIGAQMPFYIYVLHVAVGKELDQFVGNPYLKVLLIFLISFIIYEIFHLLKLIIKKVIVKYNIFHC